MSRAEVPTMTKWLVEIDESTLQAAADALGTDAVDEIIDQALRQLTPPAG